MQKNIVFQNFTILYVNAYILSAFRRNYATVRPHHSSSACMIEIYLLAGVINTLKSFLNSKLYYCLGL